MEDAATISIAMATYNGARHLEEQLESLAAQTLAPAELVVGDDGSSDDTLRILEAFAARAPFPVRIELNATRLNYGENFLQTSQRCESKYVAFCDQDDVWLPQKLERCVAVLEERGAVLCAHDAVLVDAELNKLGELQYPFCRPGEHPPLSLSPWGVFFGLTVVFRRDLLDLIPAQERPNDNIDFLSKLAHDRWVYFLAATFGSTYYLDEPLVLYRQHQDNTCGSTRPMTLQTLRHRVREAALEQSAHVQVCRQRAAALYRLAGRATGQVAATAGTAAGDWDKLADIYEQRLTIASSPSTVRRLVTLGQLARRGAYGPFDKGGLTARAFVKDVLVTLAPRGSGQASAAT